MYAAQGLFSGNGFMPHGMCYLWKPELLWLHVVSDALVAISYFAIPPTLVYLVLRARRELAVEGDAALGLKGLPYESMFLAFGVFIVACGMTHVIAVYTVWTPAYWLAGSAKAVTALASVATAVALPPLVPRAIELIRNARQAEENRQRLAEAHEELRSMNRQLQATDRLKTELFANVSHELRTPLTLILGPVERMIGRGDLVEADRSALEVVRRNALQLLGHVDDLLEAATLDEGSVEPRLSEIDLSASVRSVAANFHDRAAARNVTLEVEGPDSLRADLDRGKVERILLNLLSNAFKFTPVGGHIRVTLAGGSEASRGWAEVRVEDDGPGVPADMRDVVFERFRQADRGDTRRYGGTGLGLAIARGLAEANGGSLSLGASDLGGAAFVLRIPVHRSAGADDGAGAPVDARPTLAALDVPSGGVRRRTAGAAAGASSSEAPSVLLVEDNDEMRDFLADVLSPEFRCLGARDGEEGLATALREVPDLVVTDLMMPNKSGWQLLEDVRGEPALEDVPVLVLTARADPELPAALLAGGAQDFLTKPIRADEFASRVRNMVSSARARRLLRAELATRETDLAMLTAAMTRRKRALEQTVRDKEVLIREVHHRVKGNLQTLASMLRIQRRTVDDPVAHGVLEEVEARVGAIALVHEKLYAGDEHGLVELAGYLRTLTSRITDARGGLPAGIELDLDLEPVELEVERAIPCGLIAFELVSNALDHGLSQGAGTLTVRLRATDARIELTIEDTGSGMPGRSGPGFGVELVNLLTRQLRGTAVREDLPGVRWRLVFPRHTDVDEELP